MEINSPTTQEIPRREWVEFLDRFSQQHDGWQVTLQVLDADMGAQLVAENLPLRGISADLKTDDDEIEINVGETSTEHVNHVILCPTHIRLEVDAGGAHRALEFETENGTTTLLQFRVAAAPETVDGVVFSDKHEAPA